MSKIQTLLPGLILLAGSLTAVQGQVDDSREAVRVLPLIFSGTEDSNHLFTTTFSVMNLSNTTIEVEVAAFAEGGDAFVLDTEAGLAAHTTIRLLPSQAIRRVLRPAVDPFPLRKAWLFFRGPAGGFAASARITALRVSRPEEASSDGVALEAPEFDRRIRSDVQIDGLPPAPDLEALITWDGQQRCRPAAMSSYSFVNPNREATVVRLRFVQYVDAGNRIIHEARIEIPAATRISRLLSQIFPELFGPRDTADACINTPAHATGILEVSSDRPVNVAALSINLVTGHFVDLPVRVVRNSIADDE